MVKPMKSTFTSTFRREGLLRRHAVRSEARAAAAKDVLQVVQREPGIHDVLDDDDVTAFEAGVHVLDQPHFARRVRARAVARHRDEVQRHAILEGSHQVGQEHEGALQDAHEMDIIVREGRAKLGGHLANAGGQRALVDQDGRRRHRERSVAHG